MALDPPDRMVFEAIQSGAAAAACFFFERDGVLDHGLCLDEEAMATVTFKVSGDDQPRVRLVPMTDAPLLAARGVVVNEVSAPDHQAWTWTAAAVVVTERTLPARLIMPVSLRRRQVWVVEAHDDRGMSGALYSTNASLSSRGVLGDVLTRQVSRTTIPDAKGRLDRAKSVLNSDEAKAAIAGATVEYFSSPAALSGSDGGQALVTFEISCFDPLSGRSEIIASSAGAGASNRANRRGALSNAALGALQKDAFGTGIQSPRSRRTVISLDEPIGGNGSKEDQPTFGSVLQAADDPAMMVEQRLELTDLAARARLSKGETDVIHLRAQEHSESEIAAILGLSISTVDTQLRRARNKLLLAAKD